MSLIKKYISYSVAMRVAAIVVGIAFLLIAISALYFYFGGPNEQEQKL
jgi:hypothetical protein